MQKDKSNGNVPNSTEGSDAESEFVETDPTGRYGRYKEVLGKGAFKTVYRAFDEFEGIEVAWNQVKLQDLLHSPEDLERLYSEVHLLRSLKHKNIMKFYGSWVDTKTNNLNFITEMFTSGTLRQFRRKHKRVNLRAVKNWSRQILRGLLYLHSHDPPIIHRDLKCDNIFVNGHQGEVKIGDFGLAAILRQAHAAHSVIGTPEFMAPELYEEEYNELVDIYAFGMCVLEMVTFEYPYSECKNAAQIYKKVTSGQKPAALQKVKNPEVRAFVEKCLATVSKRLPARELLNDSFLQCHDLGRKSWVDGTREELVENTNSSCSDVRESIKSKEHVDFRDGQSGSFGSLKEDRLLGESHALHSCVEDSSFIRKLPEMMPDSGECLKRSKEFQVRGKRGSDDAILLKLRIADHEGNRRNIQFHFDVEADTAMSVASEMVAELDLSDHDVTTIAEMIDAEMMALIPDWIPGGSFDETSQLDNSETHYVADAGNWYSEMISKTLPKLHLGSHTEGQGTMHGRFEELAYNSCRSPFFGRSNEHSLLSSGSSEVKEESDEWEIDRLINADHEMSLERRSYGHHYDQVGEARKYCGDFFTAGQQERVMTADRQFFPWTNEGRSSGSSNQDDAQLKTLACRQEMELQELKKKHQQARDELNRRRYRSSVNNYSYNHNQESSEDIYCRSRAHDIYCRSEAHMQSEVDSDGVLRARNAEQRRMSLNDIFPNVGKLKTRDDSWQMKQEHFVSAPVTPKQFVREVLGPLRAEDALALAMQMGTHSPWMKCHDARTRDQVSDIPSKGPSLVACNSYSEVGQIACARSYDDMQRSKMSSRFNQANTFSEGDDFDFHAKQPRKLFGNESFMYGSDGSCNLNMKQMKSDVPGLWQQPQVCERDLQEKRKDDYSGAMRCQQQDSIQIRQGYSTKSENGVDVQFQEKSNSRKLEGPLPGKLEHAKSENALFLEQFRKEQLHKSIADLESKTLQKLYNSANVHCGGMKQNLASQRRSSISDLKRQALAQVSL